MKPRYMWIKKGCFDLLVVMVAATVYYLLDFLVGYELDAVSAVSYYMILGFIFSCISIMDRDRKCMLAVRFGASRKSCRMGIELSRAIYILGFLLSLAVLYPIIRETSTNSPLMLLLGEGAALTAGSGFAGLADVFCRKHPRYKVILAIIGFVIESGILVLLEFSVHAETWMFPLILLGIAAAAKPLCLVQERKYLLSCNA